MQTNHLEEQPLKKGQIFSLVYCHYVIILCLQFLSISDKRTCPYKSCSCIAGTNTVDGYQGHLIDCITLQSSVFVHQRSVGSIGRYDNRVAAIDTDIVAG